MKIYAGHHFSIGSTHRVCEDYAFSFAGTLDPEKPPVGLAIVSDGCSSGTFTDIGSRLWVSTVAKMMDGDPDSWSKDSISLFTKAHSQVTQVRAALGLPTTSELCTLLALTFDSQGFRLRGCGDGVWVRGKISLEGVTFEIHQISAPSNQPPYIPYFMGEGNPYQDTFGPTPLKDKVRRFSGQTELDSEERDIAPFVDETWGPEEYNFAAVFSDGLETFRGVDPKVLVDHLVEGFSSHLHLRKPWLPLLAAYRKVCIAQTHTDDLAGSYLFIAPEEAPTLEEFYLQETKRKLRL